VISQATQLDLHRHFHALGAGVIEEVRVQRVFPNVWKGPTLDLMAGSLSGGTTVLFTYMLDLIQTKLAYQVKYIFHQKSNQLLTMTFWLCFVIMLKC
jgi:hypothetical protein